MNYKDPSGYTEEEARQKAEILYQRLTPRQKERVQAKILGMSKTHPHIPEGWRFVKAVEEVMQG